MPDKKEILEIVKHNDIKFIELWFADITGALKCVTITPDELEDALEDGIGFDASSVTGFHAIEESDAIAMPDTATFSILPWTSKEMKGCRMFCDILEPDRTPFEGDTRYILKKNLKEVEKLGMKFYIGPELEYFYFKSAEEPVALDTGGYFELISHDLGDLLRKKTVIMLQKMGITVEAAHHEVAPSQHEIDLRYSPAFEMADHTLTYKKVVKQVASEHGVFASFMPKPVFGVNGSGMHIHQSLFDKKQRNLFFDRKDKYFLSEMGKQFLAGLLVHAREITAITNPTVNSYKRLVPGYEAPIYIAWSQRNRSALVRVPYYKPGKESAMRLELRSPDPSCNPYLAFAVMLAAGLEGIKNKYTLPAPVNKNIYTLARGQEIEGFKLDCLPTSLQQAIDEMKKSRLVKKTLGSHIFDHFIKLKEMEWKEFMLQVTEYERKRYLFL